MKHELLVDNWTLQSAGEILCKGPQQDDTRDLQFASDMRSYKTKLLPADVVRIEALCQLLHNIVFTDYLHIDAEYIDCWKSFTPLLQLQRHHLLKPKRFLNQEEEWLPRRDEMAEELCPDRQLRANNWQSEDVSDAKPSKAKDQYFAQLLWGGAGMLARADFFELTYASHPARERFFARTNFMSGNASAEAYFRKFVNKERVRLFERLDVLGYKGDVQLPPVAVEIILEASSTKDLLPIAVQTRAHYRKLRAWLGDLQNALNSGNNRKQDKKKKLLDDLAGQLESKNADNLGEATVSVAASWPSLSFKPFAVWKNIRNRFGVRAQVNRLILAPRGQKAVKKMVHLLGEKRTQYGMKLEQEFLRRCTIVP